MQPKIVFVAPSADVGEVAREMAPSGFDLTLVSSGGDIAAAVREAQYMLCYPHVKMSDDFYSGAPIPRLVQLLTAASDSVDPEPAPRAKVPLANNGGANAIAVAEHALLLMLAVSRKVIWQHGSVSAGRWRGNGPVPRMYELY